MKIFTMISEAMYCDLHIPPGPFWFGGIMLLLCNVDPPNFSIKMFSFRTARQ